MGSFDVTCSLSDIGIRGGDKIACLLLQEGNYGYFNGVWNPVSPFLLGEYYDYGNITLDQEPTAFLEHLKPWIVPQEAAENSCHAQAVSPERIDWRTLEQTDHDDRLFLYASSDNIPMFKEEREEKERLLYSGDHKYSRGPFWDLQEALNMSGIRCANKYEKDSCYLYAIGGTGLFAIEFSFGTKINDPMIAKVQNAIVGLGYSAYPIPENSSYDKDFPKEDRAVRLLIAPSPHDGKYLDFRGYEKPKQIHATRAYIRMDVLDALFPVDKRMIYRAQLLRDERKSFLEEQEGRRKFMLGYQFANRMGSMGPEDYRNPLGLWFKSEGSTCDYDHIAPQVLAMPDDSPVEAFIPWVRLSDVICGSRNSFRRGLRPTPKYVGSQCACEDWPEQLKYHLSMVDILGPIVAKEKEERDRWNG